MNNDRRQTLKSISDDDQCSNCAHCTYVPASDQSSCAHAFPGATDEDGYITTCVQFQSRVTQSDRVRAAVIAKMAYWDALCALERSYPTELTDKQNDAMCNAVEMLAASATTSEPITDENAQEVLNTIASA